MTGSSIFRFRLQLIFWPCSCVVYLRFTGSNGKDRDRPLEKKHHGVPKPKWELEVATRKPWSPCAVALKIRKSAVGVVEASSVLCPCMYVYIYIYVCVHTIKFIIYSYIYQHTYQYQYIYIYILYVNRGKYLVHHIIEGVFLPRFATYILCFRTTQHYSHFTE